MDKDGVNVIRASAPTDDEGRVYHLRLAKGDVPPYVVLPGAPERTLVIAEDWEGAREVASYREFRTVTGAYKGTPLAAVSTGIGAASSEICIHELGALGVHTCVRVGTTGCIQPEYDLGDLIIPSACVRRDGTSDSYIEPAYPAAADTVVTLALMQACENLGYRYGVGIGYTAASFYIGQGRPLRDAAAGTGAAGKPGPTSDGRDADGGAGVFEAANGRGAYWPSFAERLVPDLMSAGVLNIEMEAAGQFVVGRLHGMRMGAVFAVVSNRVTDRWGDAGGEEKASRAASEALSLMRRWDESGRIEASLSNRFRI